MVSVIVPVYNVEPYLERCIRSLVNQTYQELQIILVDDGSQDASPEICEKWKKKDQRIEVIHKENGGLSDARNVGLTCVKGDYIAFVDSDDWVEPTIYETLYGLLQKYKAQIAECGVCLAYDGKEIEGKKESQVQVFDREEALTELIRIRELKTVVWNKLYRKEVIGEERFRRGKLHEDEFFTYRVVDHANCVIKTNEELYNYYQRTTSIMGNYSLRHLDALEALCERMEYMQKHHPQLKAAVSEALFNLCFYHDLLGRKYLDRGEQKDARKRILCCLKKIDEKTLISNKKSFFENKYLGLYRIFGVKALDLYYFINRSRIDLGV